MDNENRRPAGKEILKRSSLGRKLIRVEAWDTWILIRELNAFEGEEVGLLAAEVSTMKKDDPNVLPKIMHWSAVTVQKGWINEDGTHVIEYEELDDLKKTQTVEVLGYIAREIRVLSKLDMPVEELKKISSITPTNDSGSTLPLSSEELPSPN